MFILETAFVNPNTGAICMTGNCGTFSDPNEGQVESDRIAKDLGGATIHLHDKITGHQRWDVIVGKSTVASVFVKPQLPPGS